jgi:hypothetical protein
VEAKEKIGEKHSTDREDKSPAFIDICARKKSESCNWRQIGWVGKYARDGGYNNYTDGAIEVKEIDRFFHTVLGL